MDTPINLTPGVSPEITRHARSELGNGIRQVKDAATGEINNLMADVEDLVSRVADVKDPELARIRSKVQAALISTRDSLVTSAQTVRRQVRQAAETTDDYVRTSPWQAAGIAALVGAALGYVVGRRR